MAYVKLGEMAEGSIIKIKEDGVLVDFCLARQNYQSDLNGAGRVLVVRKACYGQLQWNSGLVNTYATSIIDTALSGSYRNKLDPNIRAAMGTTKFYYTSGNGKWDVTTLARSVFLLSARELGHTDTSLNAEGGPLSSTVISLLGTSQWTRSPATKDNRYAWKMISRNSFDWDYCTNTCGYRPAFTLPSTLYVSDDGSVSVNTAPTMPAAITIPETIRGGTSVTISWTVSTDAENNLEGYAGERSTDSGSTWTQIYQGSATSTTNTVAFGTESVMYRVRAYDSEGLYSGYRSSAQVNVVNNTAPTAPGAITVPETVLGGGTADISWTASADGENNLAGYALERRVDGGDWAEVFRGDALSFTDAVTKGWDSVAWRVRAYDSENAYSGYTMSEARAVNNNTPPAITCALPNGSSLGVKNEGFSVSYSVSDEEGDAVTVTESVDGKALRSFAAEEGETNHLQVDGVEFMKLLNGGHTLDITASDGTVSAVHRLSFVKSVTSAMITLEQPMTADALISVCALSVAGSIPADALFTVEVTNNGLDNEPVWEDCTAAVKSGSNHVFQNETAVNGFAFNFRVTAERGDSGIGGYITSVRGGFQ